MFLFSLRCMEVQPGGRLFWQNYNGRGVIYKGEDNKWWIGEEVDANEIMYDHPSTDESVMPPRTGRRTVI